MTDYPYRCACGKEAWVTMADGWTKKGKTPERL